MFFLWLATLFGHPSESPYLTYSPSHKDMVLKDIDDPVRKGRYDRIDEAVDSLTKSGEEFVRAEIERLQQNEKLLSKLDGAIKKIKS